MIRVGVVGATGFTGVELARCLFRHSGAELVYIAADSTAGSSLSELYPHLVDRVEIVAEKYDIEKVKKLNLDLMFLALPHGASMKIVPELMQTNIKIVDLGADFRLKSKEAFEQWYKTEHSASGLFNQSIYGLPEKYRDNIKDAKLVANPGCYTTASILGIWPLSSMVNGTVIIDAKSGYSGAGKKCSSATHFCSANEGISAYKIFSHQHTAELLQESNVDLIMTPHLTPMIRGILSTIYLPLKKSVSEEQIRAAYFEKYNNEPFTKVMKKGIVLSTKMVSGSNNCFIQVYFDKERQMAIVTSVIDNLIKGASGQAIQNMNIMFGFAETDGLSQIALYP